MGKWLALLLLAGCSAAPTVEDYANACDQYGFTRGTDEHAQCIQLQAMAQMQVEANRQARLQAGGMGLIANAQRQNALAAQAPKRTWCYPSGNAMFCQ